MAFGEVGTSLSKIKANSLNLAGTFGFSGTVTGLADETPLVLISTFTFLSVLLFRHLSNQDFLI